MLAIALAGAAAGGLAVWMAARRNVRANRRIRDSWSALSTRILRETNRLREARRFRTANREYFEQVENAWLEVRRDERRLQAVLRAMSEGIALLDDKQQIVFCNPDFATLFRRREGQTLTGESLPPVEATRFQEALRTAREGGKIATIEVHVSTTPPRDILVKITPYSDELVQAGTILTALDITPHRQAEQLRTEFVANVSHELRTPLAAIRGYIETCLEAAEDTSPPPYERFIPIIHQHAMRLNALIEDLLILSRIESRAISMNVLPLQLHPTVRHVLDTLANAAIKKGVRLIQAMPDHLPDVRADVASLERILLNLVENAIKYSDENSEVRVKARIQNNRVCVMVEDDGVGIPPELQSRIFERFFRVDKARSRKAGGTGLGLSIVHDLVRALGGEVWVDSTPGRGSSFCFTLPIAGSAEPSPRASVANSAQ